MSEMVERVAKAICPDAWHETERVDGSRYFTLVLWMDEQARALREARAAIEAMREPNEAMVEEGSWHVPGDRQSLGAARTVWIEMIDAALSPALQDEGRG